METASLPHSSELRALMAEERVILNAMSYEGTDPDILSRRLLERGREEMPNI